MNNTILVNSFNPLYEITQSYTLYYNYIIGIKE